MLRKIIYLSIKNKFIVLFGILLWIGWGIYAGRHLSIDAVPDITTNQVQVITRAPTLATQEVEQYITFPIELALATLPGVVELRSISRYGLSYITVVFEEDMDIYLARQLVAQQLKVAELQIPKEFGTPELGPITTGLGEVYQYVLYAKPGYEEQYDLMALRTMNEWVVRRHLAGTPGVIEINTWGGYLKQYEVAIDPWKLKGYGLSLLDVFRALEANNGNTGAGYIEKNSRMYLIRGEGRVSSLQDIANIVITNRNGVPLRVGDVAEVRFGHALRYGAVTRNGKGEVVGGVVYMLKGANSTEVIRAIRHKVEEIQKTLPEGVVLEPFLDRSELIERTIRTAVTNLVEGALIVIFVVVFLLGNFRAGFIVASVIPLSMLFAIGMMYLFDVSANLMSLGAIDFGIIVDGSVIVVEATLTYLHRHFGGRVLSRGEMDFAVEKAAGEIRQSAAFGEIIILSVYVPILLFTGIEGKMFKPMALTVCFALLGALILSLTYVPMMSAWFLPRRIKSVEKHSISERCIQTLYGKYRLVLLRVLRLPGVVLVGAFLLLVVSGVLFWRLGGEFIPTLEEGDLALHQILPPGSSLSQAVEVSLKIQEELLKHFPEVEQVVTKIGTAEIPTDPMPVETGDIIVNLKPKEEWESAEDLEGLFEQMERVMEKIPGVHYEFSQPIQLRFNELISGVREDIAIKVFGENLDTLFYLAKKIESLIRSIEGVGDVKVEQVVGLPQIVVRYHRDLLAKYGLQVGELNRILRAAFAGEVAGVVFEGEKRFDLVVRILPSLRKDIQVIENLLIPLPNGEQIPLKEVAYVGYVEGPMQISREQTQRRVSIGVNVRGKDMESVVEAIDQVLQEKLHLPSGYFLRYGGKYQHLQEAKNRLGITVPIVLGVIFLLLYLTFGSLREVILIFLAIPFAGVGGIWALYLRGLPFSISAGIGFIALFGIAVLNGIVLMAYFLRLKKKGVKNPYRRILEGTAVRFRPILVTASVAALGFLPMALSTQPGAEVQRPLATVVIGGLVSATFLTLILLPLLYVVTEKKIVHRFPTLVVILFLPCLSYGQEVLSLEAFQDSVIRNYPRLKSVMLQIEKQKNVAKNVLSLPETEVLYGRGQINEMVNDYQFQVTQWLDFPLNYVAKSRWLRSQVDVAYWQMRYEKDYLVWKARDIYLAWCYYQTKVRLLDSLIQLAEKVVRLVEEKQKVGEVNVTEVFHVRQQHRELRLSLLGAKSELQIIESQIAQLLGEFTKKWNPEKVYPWFLSFPAIDTANLLSHSFLNLQKSKIQEQEFFYRYKKLGWLPQLGFSYLNQSLLGVPNFQAIYFGFKIPLWWMNWSVEQKNAQLDLKQRYYQYEEQKRQLIQAYQAAIYRWQYYQEQLRLFWEQGLNDAFSLHDYAMKALQRGEISYEKSYLYFQQSFNVRLRYLEVVHQYNLALSELYFLLNPLEENFK